MVSQLCITLMFVELRHNSKTFQNNVNRTLKSSRNQRHSEKINENYVNSEFSMCQGRSESNPRPLDY